MKRLFLTLALAAFAFTASNAQSTSKDKMTPVQKAEKSTAKLQKELSLTADQKQKVYAIELDKAKKSEDWHKKSKNDRKAQKDQHNALKEASDAQLDKVLNADQKKKLAADRAEKKDKKDKKEKSKDKSKSKTAKKAE